MDKEKKLFLVIMLFSKTWYVRVKMENLPWCQSDILKEKYIIKGKAQLQSHKEIMKEDKQNFKEKSINKRKSMTNKKIKINKQKKQSKKKMNKNYKRKNWLLIWVKVFNGLSIRQYSLIRSIIASLWIILRSTIKEKFQAFLTLNFLSQELNL